MQTPHPPLICKGGGFFSLVKKQDCFPPAAGTCILTILFKRLVPTALNILIVHVITAV